MRKEDSKQISLVDRSTLLLFLVTGIWYTTAYLLSGALPGKDAPHSLGWWGWYDQGQYYKTTIELAHGELKPSIYWFGYPLLGVPFYWLMPLHPYFFPNLVLVLTLVGSFFCSCRHFMGRLEAWILVTIFIFSEEILRDKCLVIPWNTLPTYTAIYLSVYLLFISKPTLKNFAVCALASSIALFSRSSEIIPLGILYFWAAWFWKQRNQWWAFVFFLFGLVLIGLFTISLNFYFYGKINSPYMTGEGGKLCYSHLIIKIYQVLCDGAFLSGNAGLPAGTRITQILERFPFFVLLLPGVIYLIKSRGSAMWGFLLSILITAGFYLGYTPLNSPPYFWTYGSFHYIWWMVPWFGFLTYLTFRQAPFSLNRKVYFVALFAPFLVYGVIGFKTVEVASSSSRAAEGLLLTTNYTSGAYTVDLICPAARIEDLRLQFSKPPSYSGTDASSGAKVNFMINGDPRFNMSEYMMSQDGNAYDFSFLSRGLVLKQGDHVRITLNQTSEPFLVKASLLQVRFSPGKAVERLVSP